MGSSSSRPTSPPPDHDAPCAYRSSAKKKNKENTIVPFLRSMSCGASSLWGTNSFTQESRIEAEDGQVMHSKCDERSRLDGEFGNIGEMRVEKNSFHHSLGAETGVGDSGAPSIGTESSSTSTSHHFLHQRRKENQEHAILLSQKHFVAHGQPSSSGPSDLPVEHCPREENESNSVSSLGSSLRVEGTFEELENLPKFEELEGSRRPPQIGMSNASIALESYQNTTEGHPLDDSGTLHVEALGLVAQTLDESSNVLRGEASGREARRNSRRRLWDALTRATSHRRSNEQGQPADESDSAVRRTEMDERSWRSRPQVWALQHFSRAMEGNSGHSRQCTFGRHQDGHCSCEAFVVTEEASTRGSISRIVMLAEALFEVLDEIHRQSMALSRSTSLSLVSLPAPGEVVDSFSSRIHTKTILW